MPVQASAVAPKSAAAPGGLDIGVPSHWITPPVENSAADSPTTTPKNDLLFGFGSADKRGETSLSFASNPTTTSNHGSRSTNSNHGSGSNHGSRSGSSDGKQSNGDAADAGSVERKKDELRNNSFPVRSEFDRSSTRPSEFDPMMLPPLPTSNFPREMADCLRELLNTQKGAGAEVPPLPPTMPDQFSFKDFANMPPFEMPAPEPPASESKGKPRVQYVPVPCITTPYGLCPLPPMNVTPPSTRTGYVYQPTEEALEKAVAACPEGFTLMPAAEVYKEYPDLQQRKFSFEPYPFDQPEAPKDVTPDYGATSPMLESFIPGGRGTTISANSGGGKFGDQMMLEKLLPDGRQRKPRLREDTNRKVFVGGLNPSTTAEGLRSYFEQFGTVSEASVVIDKVTRTSRGFGFVMFESEIPAGLLEMQHIIESRRCGVRDYGDARENESSM
jgi:hypothetical protein